MFLEKYLKKTEKTAPLAVFRVFFGLLMLISVIRFWSYGWIDSIYVQPKFYFSYYGFEFIKPLGKWTYVLFVICGLSSIMISLGYKYRFAIITFFLSFTYIELIDKTTYLNHYYFVSILSFVLIFLPLNRTFSLDAYLDPKRYLRKFIPKWNIDAIKLLLAIVYIYAGLAKLNSDWLVDALPLKIWLPNKYDTPIIGPYLRYRWAHYLFSWFGMFYDLTIPFFLLYRRTRIVAFSTVVIFHVLTHVLFPIGMFPYIMIVSTLIFFSTSFHEKIIETLSKWFRLKNHKQISANTYKSNRISFGVLSTFFVFQLLFPWRNLLYPGELFWTEEGYRFSWRVMLIEKVGHAVFKVVDPDSGKSFEIQNSDFLTPFQIKQMSTQPDFILQYAHMLRDHYKSQWIRDPEIYVKCYVTLNGRLSKLFIDPKVDLAKEKDTFAHKKWILPFQDEIKGL